MLCSESYFNEKGIDLIIDQIDQYPTLEENDVIADYTNELEVTVKDTKKESLNIAFLDFGAKDNIKKSIYALPEISGKKVKNFKECEKIVTIIFVCKSLFLLMVHHQII